ncbi:MAG: hypothetical protein WC381_01160 [Kiritimatiellia bacterium]|jgi:hypothetical protein
MAHLYSEKLSSRKKLLFSICLALFTLFLAHGLTVVYRAQPLYSYVKGPARGWRSPAFRSDPELGWAPIPGARSAHTFPIGPDIPMRLDADGFRVPLGERVRPSATMPFYRTASTPDGLSELDQGCSCGSIEPLCFKFPMHQGRSRGGATFSCSRGGGPRRSPERSLGDAVAAEGIHALTGAATRIQIPIQQGANRRRPLILAIGCSFTYGDACLAEDTFPHKVAQALGGTELNAGVCSYGLAQMLLLAERLIPRYAPDYVLIQYSPWLVDRAILHFGPTYFSYACNPFFADASAGGVELCPPVFSNYEFDIDFSPWRASPRGPLDFASFLLRRALPLCVHNDVTILSYRTRRALGLVRPPTQNRGAVLKTVYGRIQALCAQNGARPLIVVLGDSVSEITVPKEISALEMPVANAHAALIAALSEPKADAYRQAYAHFRGSPPVSVDGHPNPHAHTLIAGAIVDYIRAKSRP